MKRAGGKGPRAAPGTRVPKRISEPSSGLRLKIGVMGGAGPVLTHRTMRLARTLGAAIAQQGCVTVTGACPGLPLAAADGATAAGGLVIGISPALSQDEHVRSYRSPVEGHDVLIFTGSGLMGREIVNIRSSDIVVIVGGRSGTLGELAIAYDEGKLIGVLRGSGGITRIVPQIIRACHKDTGARLIYDADPARLIRRLVRAYRRDHYRRPSCHMATGRTAAHSARSVRDPVCGMWLDPKHAITRRRGQLAFHFCCARCARTFDRDPALYARQDWSVG